MTKDRILIIDGLNTFIRNWVIVPSMNINGESVGGVLGFLRSVKMMIRESKPTKVIVVWDGKDGSRKRRSMYSGYKEGRKPRVNRTFDFDTPEQSKVNMQAQYAKVRQLLELLGVMQVEVEGCEADDVIAYLCQFTYHDTDKVILSTDRDFYQLIDAHTIIYSASKKIYLTGAFLKETVGVIPGNYVFVKALMGDGSDNIKGIKGIGEKTAVKLFPFLSERQSDLNEIFAHAAANADKSPKYKSVLENQDVLLENVKLMQLTTPIISAQSVMAIQYTVARFEAKFVFTEFKLQLAKDGIQLTDADFFSVFKEYMMRSQREGQLHV